MKQFHSQFGTYNDGMISVYKPLSSRKTDFNAQLNPKSLDDLEFLVKLAYCEESKRQQDLEYAEQAGFQLSLKVKTRLVKSVKTKYKAVINGYLYDISYMDTTKDEMYLYLEGVRSIVE